MKIKALYIKQLTLYNKVPLYGGEKQGEFKLATDKITTEKNHKNISDSENLGVKYLTNFTKRNCKQDNFLLNEII